jgi:hypothetical protein
MVLGDLNNEKYFLKKIKDGQMPEKGTGLGDQYRAKSLYTIFSLKKRKGFLLLSLLQKTSKDKAKFNFSYQVFKATLP